MEVPHGAMALVGSRLPGAKGANDVTYQRACRMLRGNHEVTLEVVEDTGAFSPREGGGESTRP